MAASLIGGNGADDASGRSYRRTGKRKSWTWKSTDAACVTQPGWSQATQLNWAAAEQPPTEFYRLGWQVKTGSAAVLAPANEIGRLAPGVRQACSRQQHSASSTADEKGARSEIASIPLTTPAPGSFNFAPMRRRKSEVNSSGRADEILTSRKIYQLLPLERVRKKIELGIFAALSVRGPSNSSRSISGKNRTSSLSRSWCNMDTGISCNSVNEIIVYIFLSRS
jgi:hypothetical protein